MPTRAPPHLAAAAASPSSPTCSRPFGPSLSARSPSPPTSAATTTPPPHLASAAAAAAAAAAPYRSPPSDCYPPPRAAAASFSSTTPTTPSPLPVAAAAVAVCFPGSLEKKAMFYKALQWTKKRGGRLHESGLGKLRLAELPDPLDTTPKEDLSELFTPLSDKEEREVDTLLYNRNHSDKVIVIHEPSNIEITNEKFQCLRPRGWLNDEVINLYIELLKEREEREHNRFLKCHFFNTFFYKKLTCGIAGYDYQSVRRWTTFKRLGYGLIECEKIFVPVHRNVHWCLVVINMKDKTLQYLDSLGGLGHDVLKVLTRYIVDELKDKSNLEVDPSSWVVVSESLPLQQNGWDCGMFMLKYIDFHSRGIKPSFSQEHMMYFRNRTAKEIMTLRAD
ncbi:unnamed protein product [Miscanthus lutarioriparius]|uniref:Ubiquitin-like protease family profile domain-containing protein n=1 Tax=Miscanthus lutarioriparius TaxID=422564 RepID=A0A811N771_9POAL|nr:unnamed protein product [Miscanthus lutarioriparius]